MDLRSGKNPCFKISKNPHPNLGETMKNPIPKMKLPILIKSKLHKFQGIRLNHTTNLIDVEIWLLFAFIEEYFLDFFFRVCLACKARFRSILAMIPDQSCLNMIAIESRTQGDMKNLRFCFQNTSLLYDSIKSYAYKETTSFL